MTSNRPRIWEEHPTTLDSLTALAGVQIPGSKLREGMLLLDPVLMTPGVSLDKKTPAQRGSGNVSFLAFNLDQHDYLTVSVHANAMVWVASV